MTTKEVCRERKKTEGRELNTGTEKHKGLHKKTAFREVF